MRYFVVLFLMVILAGNAFAQENTDNDEGITEEPTHALVAEEDRINPNGRDLMSIREKINEIKEVVQTDYEVLLATDPEAAGTLSISFSITPEGLVSEPVVDCPEALVSLQEDVLSTLAGLDFGPAPDQTEDIPVTVPFTLNPPQ